MQDSLAGMPPLVTGMYVLGLIHWAVACYLCLKTCEIRLLMQGTKHGCTYCLAA